jgi:hypothetical protein
MIGQIPPTAQTARGTIPSRGSIPTAPQESRGAMARSPWHDRGWRRRTLRKSAQRRRILAFVAEHLEGRSVPSGFGAVSLSVLAPVVQYALQSTGPLARDVVTSNNLGGPAVVLSPGATAPPPAVEGTVRKVTGAVLDALDSVSKVLDVATVPVVPPIDVSATISPSTALPPIAPADSNIVTDLVGALDGALDALSGGALAGSGVSNSGGESVGTSIATGSGRVDAEISASVSSQDIALTLPGLRVDEILPVSPLDPTGGSPVPNPPSDPTRPTAPGNPTAPTIPVAPTSGGGSMAAPLPSSGSLGDGASTGASPVPPTGSTAGDQGQADGSAAGAQSAAPVHNRGSVTSPGVLGATTAHEATSSTTAPSIAPRVPAPTENAAAMGQGRLEDEQGCADSSSLGIELSSGTEITPAEFLPGDLESLERALARLMRRLDGMGEDLAPWFRQSSMLEMLVATGMVVLASEVFRRWERRRRLDMPRGRVGSSGRPGPFYRPRAYPFGCRGPGRLMDRPALF